MNKNLQVILVLLALAALGVSVLPFLFMDSGDAKLVDIEGSGEPGGGKVQIPDSLAGGNPGAGKSVTKDRVELGVPKPKDDRPTPAAGMVLTGRVSNSAGEGLAGVEVELLRVNIKTRGWSPKQLRNRWQRSQDFEKKIAQAAKGMTPEQVNRVRRRMLDRQGFDRKGMCKTGETGVYSFSGVRLPGEPGMKLALACHAPDGFITAVPLLVEPAFLGPGKAPDLILYRSGAISGVVVGLAEKWNSARVMAWCLGEQGVLEKREVRVGTMATFSLDDMPPGKWRLGVSGQFKLSGFNWGPLVALREGEIRQGVNLNVAGTGGLEVLIYGPGRVPMETTVRLQLDLVRAGPPGTPGAELAIKQSVKSMNTPAGEPVCIESLAPGFYRLQAQLANTGMPTARRGGQERSADREENFIVTKDVSVTQGCLRVELVFTALPALGSLEVRVITRDGAPVSGAIVRLWGLGRRRYYGAMQGQKTGTDGVVTVRGLPPLRYRVNVTHRGFATASKDVDFGKTPGEALRRDLKLVRLGVISGQVVDVQGKGVPGIRVKAGKSGQRSSLRPGRLTPRSFIPGRSTRTDRDGNFSLTRLAIGVWELKVDDKDRGVAGGKVELREGENARLTLRLEKP